MIAFIEEHQGEFGVEPICRVLPITPSSCYRHAALARDPDLASDRARQDATDLKEIKRVHDESKGRYGARKVWHRLAPGRQGYYRTLHCRAADERAWITRGYARPEQNHDP